MCDQGVGVPNCEFASDKVSGVRADEGEVAAASGKIG